MSETKLWWGKVIAKESPNYADSAAGSQIRWIGPMTSKEMEEYDKEYRHNCRINKPPESQIDYDAEQAQPNTF